MKELLPHAEPMILLDKVISIDEDSLTAEVMIRPDSLFCEEEGVGAWVGIEYMAQTIAAYAGNYAKIKGEPIKIGFLVGTRRYESTKSLFAIGSVLRISAKCILQSDNGLSAFECDIHEAGVKIASAIINTFLPDNINIFLEENAHE